jgi:hypothetical protein
MGSIHTYFGASGKLGAVHTGPVDFVLRSLAARKLLQQREFLRRCAVEKPVIHANCSGNEAEERGQRWLWHFHIRICSIHNRTSQ